MSKVELINDIAGLAFFAWNWAGIFASVDELLNGKLGVLGNLGRRFISEFKPFYFPVLAVWFVTQTMIVGPSWKTPLGTLWYILVYFIYRKYDDDSWKKRMEKLLEKVEVSEGKLVVVPN